MAGAPLGNKNAVGSTTSGRPESIIDFDAMAKKLLDWSLLETSTYITEFALEQGTYGTALYDWRDKSIVFSEALRNAKDRLSVRLRKRMEDPSKKTPEKLAMKDLGYHDSILRHEINEEKELDARLKARQDAQAAMTLAQLSKASASGELSQSYVDNQKVLEGIAQGHI